VTDITRVMGALAVAALLASVAGAQAPREAPQGRPEPLPEDVLPLSDLRDDPIGVGGSSRGLDRVARQHERRAAERSAELHAEQARFGPSPPEVRDTGGEVLWSSPAVRETRHVQHVELQPGLARVRVEMRFSSKSPRPAELRYRLALPPGAAVSSLRVCDGRGCREGLEDRSTGRFSAYDAAVLARGEDEPLPVAHVHVIDDARGTAALLRAAPVRRDDELRVELAYAVPVAFHGGALQLELPARGMDPRVAPTELSLHAKGLREPRIGRQAATDVPVLLDAWAGTEISARVPPDAPLHATALRHRCGTRTCALVQAGAAPAEPQPRDLIVALDVSPSTEGPARGRLLSTISALLTTAPPGSRVRALAFASRAEVLVADPMDPAQVALRPFARAIAAAELGSATRFEAVWRKASEWLGRRGGRPPAIVIVGDGGMTSSSSSAVRQAQRAGVEVSVVSLAARGAVPPLRALARRSGGLVIRADEEASTAARGGSTTALEARLAALFAPTVARRVRVLGAVGGPVSLGDLRAGEMLWWHGPVRGGATLRVGRHRARARSAAGELATALGALGMRAAGEPAPALAAVDPRDFDAGEGDWPEARAGRKDCDRRGPARRHSGINHDSNPVTPVEARACAAPSPADSTSSRGAPGRGMPAEPLLQMRRRRIMPVARGCFRRDRAGRARYDRRAVFVFTLAEREVVSARVEGRIGEPLRECLERAIDGLDVPRFSGVVNVRYPLITESAEVPERIELSGATARQVDTLLGSGDAP
jgi:hypothetical protein